MAEHPISISKQIDKMPPEFLEHMESYLFTRDLAIAGEEQKDPRGIKFLGKAELWNLKCEIECLFKPLPPTMILCARPETDGWNFGDCFPLMPAALSKDDTDTGAPDNGGDSQQHDGSSSGFFLRHVGLQNGLLVYAYTPKENNNPNIAQALENMALYQKWSQGRHDHDITRFVKTLLQNGLVMAGDFVPGELLKRPFGSLLSGFLNLPDIFNSKFPVEATIGYKGLLPGLQVQLPLPFQPRFGQVAMVDVAMEDAHIALTSPIYPLPEYSRLIVECIVEILNTRLRIEADLPVEGDLIIASASLLGDQQNFYKSPNPNILPDMGLDENMKIELAFSKTDCQLERVLLAAHANNWHVLPDPFEFRELALSVLIFPSQENLILASFLADVMLGDIGLTFGGFYPSGPLTCSLDADTPLKLRDIGNKFDIGDFLPDLTIAQLDFSYDFLMERISALLYITGDRSDGVESWTHVALQDLIFRFNGPAPYTAEAGAHLKIGTAQLSLLGKYSDKGWQFDGSTGPGQQIPIGVFIKEIGEMFGAKPEIPEWLEDMTIKDLGLSFKTEDNQFQFTCEVDLPISDQDSLAARLFFNVTHKDQGYTCDFTGKFDVTLKDKALAFVLAYKHDDKADRLIATFKHDGNLALKVSDLFKVLVPNDTDLTDLIGGFDIAVDVQDIQLGYSKNKETSKTLFGMYFCAGISLSGENPTEINTILFASSEQKGQTKFLFGLNIDAAFSLSSVPLVRAQLPSGQDIGIKDMQLFAASQEVLSDDLEQAKLLLPLERPEKFPTPKTEDSDEPAKKEDPDKPAVILAEGLTVDASLMLGPDKSNVILLSGESPKHKQTPEALPGDQGIKSGQEENSSTDGSTEGKKPLATKETESSVKWFKVQKSIGPVRFDRFGFQYEEELVWFLIDASLSAAGLTISLQGFGIGSSLTSFKPDFKLQGLAINFKNDPVEISGAFLMTEKNKYSGMALIKAKSFMLSAIGSYEIVGKDTSLFVFAYLDTPLGGPPCFYVTGLAAGFGYNSTVIIPSIQEVKDFPLLAAMVDPSKMGIQKDEPADPTKILASMNQWIKPLHGSYWLAAGITFRSFEIINSNVLAIAQFGKEFQVLIVGLSTIQLPKTGKTYAYAELMIQITIKPAQGFIGAMAQLSPNSYLFDPGCHLTGGFAFYLWFGSSQYAGDFVLTIGGYHPAFKVPPHYPQPLQVPRLGFIWPISGNVMIKGEAYFALTPSCVMAGGRLEVLYQAGNLQAWFIAQADLIIFWKPFYFIANIYIRIGVSYRVKILFVRKTLRVELGASVELWGPPTGGRVHVSWWIISFTVSFGAGKQTSPCTLDWEGFKTMLPQSVIKINVNSGLLPQNDGKNGTQGKKCWIIRPDEFAFSIETAIPATETRAKDDPNETTNLGTAASPQIGIRPMGIETINSPLTISILKEGEKDPQPISGEWDYKIQTGNMPEAMWGKPANENQLPEAKLIDKCLVGINNIRRKQPKEPSGPPEIEMEKAFTFFVVDREEDDSIPESLPLPPAGAKTATGVPTANNTLKVIHDTLMRKDIEQNRLSIFKTLADMGVGAGDNGSLKALADNPAANFDASPMEMTRAQEQ